MLWLLKIKACKSIAELCRLSFDFKGNIIYEHIRRQAKAATVLYNTRYIFYRC